MAMATTMRQLWWPPSCISLFNSFHIVWTLSLLCICFFHLLFFTSSSHKQQSTITHTHNGLKHGKQTKTPASQMNTWKIDLMIFYCILKLHSAAKQLSPIASIPKTSTTVVPSLFDAFNFYGIFTTQNEESYGYVLDSSFSVVICKKTEEEKSIVCCFFGSGFFSRWFKWQKHMKLLKLFQFLYVRWNQLKLEIFFFSLKDLEYFCNLFEKVEFHLKQYKC